MTELEHLRALLDDAPTFETDIATSVGGTTVYQVRNPPLTDSAEVRVDGVQLTRDASFFITDGGKTITSHSPWPPGATITIRYTRQTFTDAELAGYLALASAEYDTHVGRVVAAAVFALDTLLTGSASALNFGAGSETFDMVSVFDRLARLRAMLLQTLADERLRPRLFAPVEPIALPYG